MAAKRVDKKAVRRVEKTVVSMASLMAAMRDEKMAERTVV